MKFIRYLLTALVLASIPILVVGQSLPNPVSASGTLSAAATSVTINLGGYTGVGVQVTGSCGTCTLQFESTLDGTNWVAVNMTPPNSTTPATNTTSTGAWNGSVVGSAFRVRMSARSSGSFVVTIRGTLTLSRKDLGGGGGGGSGTVTSVDLSVPTGFSVSGNPITSSGTITVGLSTEVANQVFAGPTTAPDATPGFRALVAADIPNLAASKITSGQVALARGGTNADLSATGGTSQVLKQTGAGSAVTVARLACADLSNAGSGCSGSVTAPGGSNTQVQFNNSNAFGGAAALLYSSPNTSVVVGDTGVSGLDPSLLPTGSFVVTAGTGTADSGATAAAIQLMAARATDGLGQVINMAGTYSAPSAQASDIFITNVGGSHSANGHAITGTVVGRDGYVSVLPSVGGSYSRITSTQEQILMFGPGSGTQNITRGEAIHVLAPILLGNATLVNNSGIYLDDQTTAGTTTNYAINANGSFLVAANGAGLGIGQAPLSNVQAVIGGGTVDADFLDPVVTTLAVTHAAADDPGVGRVYVSGASQADIVMADSAAGANLKYMQMQWNLGAFTLRALNDNATSKQNLMSWSDTSGVNASVPFAANSGFGVGGSAPAVANVGANSCGTTAATIAGNDNAGAVTVGATSGTQCRLTMTVTASNRWHCTASNESTANLTRAVYVDTTHVDLVGVFGAGDVVSYLCMRR